MKVYSRRLVEIVGIWQIINKEPVQLVEEVIRVRKSIILM